MVIEYEETLYSKLTTLLSKSTKTGKFEVYKEKVGEYRFKLKAQNGEVIATSEGYSSKESCIYGIQSVTKNTPKAKIVELKK
jgi:uncharacterized protein YegP (UPF0339 family)